MIINELFQWAAIIAVVLWLIRANKDMLRASNQE